MKREDIILENELGSGAFGLVYRGSWQMNCNQRALDVAVKARSRYKYVTIVHVSAMSLTLQTLNDNSGDEDRLLFLNEASIMK